MCLPFLFQKKKIVLFLTIFFLLADLVALTLYLHLIRNKETPNKHLSLQPVIVSVTRIPFLVPSVLPADFSSLSLTRLISYKNNYKKYNFTFLVPDELNLSNDITEPRTITITDRQNRKVLFVTIRDRALTQNTKAIINSQLGEVQLLSATDDTEDKFIFQHILKEEKKVIVFECYSYGKVYPQAYFEKIMTTLRLI